MLYALKNRSGSGRVANQIIVLPLEQPLHFILWRMSKTFKYHHRWILAIVETNTERIRWATILYAMKNRNGSRRVAKQIIVLPLEQPLLFILWGLVRSFQYNHRWNWATVKTNTERIGEATMLYAMKIRNGSRRVANQLIVLPLEQPLLFILSRLSWSFQYNNRWIWALVETNTERIRWATMLYAMNNRNGSKRVADQLIVRPLEQPLLFIPWRLSWIF